MRCSSPCRHHDDTPPLPKGQDPNAMVGFEWRKYMGRVDDSEAASWHRSGGGRGYEVEVVQSDIGVVSISISGIFMPGGDAGATGASSRLHLKRGDRYIGDAV